MGGCTSKPNDKYETSKEVADLKAQVDQLQRALAVAKAGQSGFPPAYAPSANYGQAPPYGNAYNNAYPNVGGPNAYGGGVGYGPPAGAAAGATGGVSSGSGGVVETLFFPDAKLPCRNMNKPGGCRRPHCEYAHEPTSLTRFLAHLGSARSSLDICVFTITNDDISDVVLSLHRRGVRVRIITDNDQAATHGSDIVKFVQAGIPVRRDKTPAHMHHKFALIDGRLLLNGSFNWTRQAVTGNNENVTVLADPQLIRSFQAQFNKLWEQFK